MRDTRLVTVLQRDLGRGEAEAIALALERNADLVLLDEREGRRAARRLGLSVTGVLGLLVEAKAKGHVATLRPLVDALRQVAGFYVHDEVYRAVLRQVGE
ncbi:DUF3368 domain-containing protein [Rhodocaloribacter litoris]|uniref:DUF3368 domain-containing protein n=1 Tax=Rhodocaloribacter litoris TaxID=2558931 RepID=UPI001E30FFAF|nr:DUF3368 domain-containing protein [Rhodocaloribacter litoris]QXD16313.1 DUF3368 domain-containing protein [Rhodocaloribacter litoris]